MVKKMYVFHTELINLPPMNSVVTNEIYAFTLFSAAIY